MEDAFDVACVGAAGAGAAWNVGSCGLAGLEKDSAGGDGGA